MLRCTLNVMTRRKVCVEQCTNICVVYVHQQGVRVCVVHSSEVTS